METAPTMTPAPLRTRLQAALLAAAALTAASLITAGLWWASDPDVFEDYGAGWRGAPVSVQNAEFQLAVTGPAQPGKVHPLTFTSTPQPNLARATADAQVTITLCRPEPGSDKIGMIAAEDLDTYCRDHETVKNGTTMTLTSQPDTDYLVATVKLTKPGRATLDRLDVDYTLDRAGLYRRGSDSIALDLTVQAR